MLMVITIYLLILIFYSKTTQNFNAPMGKAAKFTIAEVIVHSIILNLY